MEKNTPATGSIQSIELCARDRSGYEQAHEAVHAVLSLSSAVDIRSIDDDLDIAPFLTGTDEGNANLDDPGPVHTPQESIPLLKGLKTSQARIVALMANVISFQQSLHWSEK